MNLARIIVIGIISVLLVALYTLYQDKAQIQEFKACRKVIYNSIVAFEQAKWSATDALRQIDYSCLN